MFYSESYKLDKDLEKGQYVMTAIKFSLRGEQHEHHLEEWKVGFSVGDKTNK